MTKTALLSPKIVIKNGKPAEVILNYKKFLNVLEMIEDVYDLREIEKIKKKSLSFKKLKEIV